MQDILQGEEDYILSSLLGSANIYGRNQGSPYRTSFEEAD